MPKRKNKKYRRPKRIYDSKRIEEEDLFVKKYGLKNKREIWKVESMVGKIRRQAKTLLTKSVEEQEKFIDKLRKQGFEIKNIADILALNQEDYLKRRLQNIIVKKKLASTPRQARQFIVHKHVAIDGKRINIPSYLVKTEEEDKISLTLVKKEKPKTKNIEESLTKEQDG